MGVCLKGFVVVGGCLILRDVRVELLGWLFLGIFDWEVLVSYLNEVLLMGIRLV